MQPSPPKYAEKLLLLFLRDDFAEEVLGDLDEKFLVMLTKTSPRRARLNYWFQVINYMRPFAFKYFRSNSNLLTMINHNFLVGARILLKNKLFSTINIGGLAIGMMVAILVGLWIHDEFSFNKGFENYDRTVQVLRKDSDDEIVEVNSSLPGQLGQKLAADYGNYFEQTAMTFYRNNPQLLKVGKVSLEQSGYYFEPAITRILEPEMVMGNPNGLDDDFGILLSETLANKLFRDEDPIGKNVAFNVSTNLVVTGVYKDFPKNSTFGDAQFLVSLHLVYNAQNPHVWNNYNIRVYGLLREDVAIRDASVAIRDVLNNELNLEEPIDLLLIAMKDWHLNSFYVGGFQVTSPKMKFIWLYAIVGMLVLLIACINFMNLNTARYQTRIKEVGVRKAVGSFRSNLITQFLSESLLYSVAALFLSLIVVYLLLPSFNTITEKALIFPGGNVWFWLICLAFALFATLLAGSYPAAFLSSFNPVKALRGNAKPGSGSIRFRQLLVIFQFVVSIILIIGTIVVYQQISYAKDRPVGYNQDRLMTIIGRSDDFYINHNVIRNDLKSAGVVEEVAVANYPLTNTLGNNNGFMYNGERIDGTFNTIFTGPEYGATVQWELLAGRNFSRELDESGSIILSASAVDMIGLDDPIGKVIQSSSERNGKRRFNIIGVVNDMVKASPFEPTQPLMVFCTKSPMPFMFIRLRPGTDYVTAIPQVQAIYEKHLPDEGFNYNFIEDQYLIKFKDEEQIGNFAAVFCLLAILISCLGLFGLSSFVVSQRVKEIGIRKVLGASVPNLWSLLSRDFGVLVLISCVIAIPVAFYILSGWLDGYGYSVDLESWVFIVGSATCILITLATVSYHSIKVSRANPVESLRAE